MFVFTKMVLMKALFLLIQSNGIFLKCTQCKLITQWTKDITFFWLLQLLDNLANTVVLHRLLLWRSYYESVKFNWFRQAFYWFDRILNAIYILTQLTAENYYYMLYFFVYKGHKWVRKITPDALYPPNSAIL